MCVIWFVRFLIPGWWQFLPYYCCRHYFAIILCVISITDPPLCVRVCSWLTILARICAQKVHANRKVKYATQVAATDYVYYYDCCDIIFHLQHSCHSSLPRPLQNTIMRACASIGSKNALICSRVAFDRSAMVNSRLCVLFVDHNERINSHSYLFLSLFLSISVLSLSIMPLLLCGELALPRWLPEWTLWLRPSNRWGRTERKYCRSYFLLLRSNCLMHLYACDFCWLWFGLVVVLEFCNVPLHFSLPIDRQEDARFGCGV